MVTSSKILDLFDKGFVYYEPDLDKWLQNENPISEFNFLARRNQITKKGGQDLCRGIARYLRKLGSLTFKLSTSGQEDLKLAKVTFRMISCLTNLKDLNLSVPQIDDEDLAELISYIGKKLKNYRLCH